MIWWRVLFLGYTTLVSTFGYYFIITSIFEIKHKRFKLVSTAIFFVLYGFVRVYIFDSIFFIAMFRQNTFLIFVTHSIHNFSIAAGWILMLLIIRWLFVIAKEGLEEMRLQKKQ